MFRLVAVALIALALGFCAPEPPDGAAPPLPGLLSPEAQPALACDAGADQPGTANAKTTVVALSVDRSDIALAEPEPSAAATIRAVSAPDQAALAAPACRAPPLA